MARYRIAVEGKAAHAGTAHEYGASAILQIADVIRRVAGFTDYQQAITFNVGTIAGGTVINRVPHQASAFVEMRASEGAALAAVISAQVDGIAEAVAAARALAGERAAHMQRALTEALERITGTAGEADPDRVAQELALIAVKTDVAEELDRLDASFRSSNERPPRLRELLEAGGLLQYPQPSIEQRQSS